MLPILELPWLMDLLENREECKRTACVRVEMTQAWVGRRERESSGILIQNVILIVRGLLTARDGCQRGECTAR